MGVQNCQRLGLKLLAGRHSQSQNVLGLCTAEGAGVEHLLQPAGLTRFDGNSADIWIELDDAGFDTLVAARTSLSDQARFRVTASDDPRIALGLALPRSYWDAASKTFSGLHFGPKPGKSGCGAKACSWRSADFKAYRQSTKGVLFDSGTLDHAYASDLVFEASETLPLKFLRLRIYDPLAGRIDIQRLLVGQALQGACDVDAGWGIQVVDAAAVQTSVSGTRLCGCGPKKRKFSGTWSQADAALTQTLLADDLNQGRCQEFYILPCVDDPKLKALAAFWGMKEDTSAFTSRLGGRFTAPFSLIEV